jgi:hypothetical protein
MKARMLFLLLTGASLHAQSASEADGNAAQLKKLVAESKAKGLLFGMDNATGMIGVYSLEREVVPDSPGRADVPGRLVFPSPDGRFAINHPTTEQAEKTQYEVENHLVSLKTKKALIAIPNQSGGDFERRNHGGMRVQWCPDSSAALVICEGKWEPSTFCALVIDAENKARAIDLMEPVYKAIIAQMKRRWPEIHQRLELEGEVEFGKENVPWNMEYARYGAEFTKDGNGARVIAEFETNGKRMEGQVVAKAAAEGVFTLADESFKLTSAAVSEAGVVTYNDAGDEVLKPKIAFPKTGKKAKR